MPNVQELAAPVKMLLMDVDGVLTDGRLYNVPGPDGNMVETKAFDSQDGIALQWLHWKGIKTGLISGRVSPATAERARQCHFEYVFQVLEQLGCGRLRHAHDLRGAVDAAFLVERDQQQQLTRLQPGANEPM